MGQFKNKITELAEKAGVINNKTDDYYKILDFANSIDLIYKILDTIGEEPVSIDENGYKKFTILIDDKTRQGIMINKIGPTSYSIILYYRNIGISHFLTMHDSESIYSFINKINEAQYITMCYFIDFIYEYLEQKVG